MTDKIFRLTFLSSVLSLLFCLVLILGVLFGFFENQIKKELASEADYISYAVEEDGGNSFFQNFKSDERRVTLIAENGDVIHDTGADETKMDNHADREEFRDAEKYGTGMSFRYSDTLTKKTFYYAKRLSGGEVLRVSTTQYTVVSILLGLLQPIAFMVLLALMLSIFLASKTAKSFVRPINSIDLDNPEECETYEELSPLLKKIINQNKTIKNQLDSARRHQEEFKLITENMSEGLIVIDKSERVLSHNSAALKLLQTDKFDDANVLTINRSREFRRAVSEALGGESYEETVARGEKTNNIISSPVYDKGKIIGAVIMIVDVTESARREAIRREFTANVSHELKTPLTSISGFAELMMNGGVDEKTVSDFSKSIYTEAQRLITLVSDIIKISELDEKSEQFVSESVDLYDMANEILNRLEPAAEKKNIDLKLEGEYITVNGVRQILDEMIFNLCDNAIKYNNDGGSVTVLLSYTNGRPTVTVKDTGIGIAQDKISRIFERFYRVDKSRSKSEGGTGLGLSIVKHGAMYHNADIFVKSTLGVGTEISIVFK